MPTSLGPWTIEEELGRGGQGVVWACVHQVTGRKGAVKGFLRGGARAEAWRDEARAMAGLAHPGVVWVHDIGTLSDAAAEVLDVPPGSPWMVMDRADGSLHDLPPTTLGGVLDLMGQALDALAHVHARDLLHLDLKPANLLRFGDRVCLADFGVARWMRDQREAGKISGTPLFMAPELIQDDPVGPGPWSDLYALGWVAWSLIAPHPFEGRTVPSVLMAQLWDTPEPPGPPVLADWLQRCVAKRPEGRFPSAADARRALQAVRATVRGDLKTASTGPPQATTTFDFQDLERPKATPASKAPARPARPASRPPYVPSPPVPDDWRIVPGAAPAPLPQVGLGLFHLRAVPIVGRDAERDALWTSLQATATGDAQVCALRGPSGMGKSALARWLLTTARQLGVAQGWVTRGAHDPSAADALGELVADGLSRTPARPEGLTDHAWAVLTTLARRNPDPVPLTRSDIVDALRTWLERSAATRPVVLVIDDAHHAVTLLEVLRDVGPVPGVLWLLTVQDEAAADHPAVEDALQALGAHSVRVEALPTGERQRLIGQLLGLSDALSDALVRRTDGHPLFAIQLLQDWIDRGLLTPGPAGFEVADGAELPLPQGLWTIWHDRVERLVRGAAERDALERAAVLATFTNVVAPSEWRLPAPLRERLLNARLADATPEGGLRFVHGLLREALVEDAREGGRLPSHHAAVAAHVGDPERKGRHLHAAGALAEALAPLTDAARDHLNRDPARAAELLALAEACLSGRTPDREVVGLAIARSGLALTQGRAADARACLDAAVHAASTPALAVQLHARRTKLAIRTGRLDAAAACVDAMQPPSGSDVGAALWPAAQLAVAARWRAEVLLAKGDHRGARQKLEPWLHHIPDGSIDAADAWFTWACIARAAGDADEARHGFEHALAAYDVLGVATPKIAVLGGLADALRFLGELDEAREAATEMARLARSRDPDGVAFATLTLAAIDVAAGDLRLGASRVDVLLSDPHRHPALAATAWSLRLLIHAQRGNGDGVDEALERLEELLLDRTHAVLELDVLLACEQAAEVLGPHPERSGRATELADQQRAGLYGP